MRTVFSNPDLNKQFLEQGYVVIDLLDKVACNEALELCRKLHTNQTPEVFFTTTHSFDFEYRKLCNDAITDFLLPKLKSVLYNYLPLHGNFMIKPKGDNSECGLHQDWTFVDENKFRSVNVWVALQDTNIDNGCIHVVPFSHKFLFPVRGRNIRTVYGESISLIKENLLKPVPIRAGQCVIFDSALLHYSPNNVSDKARIVVSLMFYPNDAQLIHYVYDKQNFSQVTKFLVEQEFFVQLGSSEDYFSEDGEIQTISTARMSYPSILEQIGTLRIKRKMEIQE